MSLIGYGLRLMIILGVVIGPAGCGNDTSSASGQSNTGITVPPPKPDQKKAPAAAE